MTMIKFIPLITLLLLLVSCKEDTQTPDQPDTTATAYLYGMLSVTDSTYLVGEAPYGQATFSQKDSVVTITIALEHFPPNTIHAVHLHQGGCEMPGMHWNLGEPMTTRFCNETSLGIPWAKPMAGDVGNVSVSYDGSGVFTIKTDLWRLGSQDHRDILGLSIIIHEAYEDFITECDPSHTHNHTHPNAKVACGIITLD